MDERIILSERLPTPAETYQLIPFWQNRFQFGEFIPTWYEVYSSRSGQVDSQNLDTVNEYLQNITGANFTGTWMLLVQWNTIPVDAVKTIDNYPMLSDMQ